MRATSAAVLFVLLAWSTTISIHAASLETASAKLAREDFVGAARDLALLAARGNARAQVMLGFLYETGQGVPQAYDAAAYWYCLAAEQGDSSAQYLLGLAYDKGHGVPQNDVVAYKWLDLAAARASKTMRDQFARLRNAVASKMSKAQIRAGQRLALSWSAGPHF
jgi:TPR repeat protein